MFIPFIARGVVTVRQSQRDPAELPALLDRIDAWIAEESSAERTSTPPTR